ncbi:MAG: hypothetical protein COB15_11955 [Flavobacteriales bacterium]|nr:MAG: hypothetical protein COB15_11955 [Flavobacteriales bacterium]
MRNIYLCAIALSVGSISFGQQLNEKTDFGTDDLVSEHKSSIKNTINNKGLGVVIWSDDFDTPSDWAIDNNGQSGAQFGWTIDATSDGWWTTNGINSVSGGNYAELSNGNAQTSTQVLNVTYTLTTKDSINLIALGGSENATLEFNQYGARFNDLTEIQISTDGVTWVTVGNNLDKLVHSASSSNPWSNPDFKTINLAPFLNSTTAASVWLRFSWTTNYPNLASNPTVWMTYGWYLDDLKIRTNPDNDMKVTRSSWGSTGIHYSKIPTSQVTQIDFRADVINQGVNTLLNPITTVTINGNPYSSPTGTTILAAAIDSLVASFTPPATPASYSFTWTTSSDSIDDNPADNDLVGASFDVGGLVYSRDTYCASPGTAGGNDNTSSTTSEEFEAGNMYDIFATDIAYGIDVVIGTGTAVGEAIDVKLYDFTSGSFVPVGSASNPHVISASDIGNELQLRFPAGIALTAGNTYFAAVHAYGGGSGELFYATCGNSPNKTTVSGPTSYIFYPTMDNPVTGQNYFTTQTPMVRLNFDPTLGVVKAKETTNFSVFPNPSNGNFTITLDGNTENVALSVKNIVGQTIINKTVNVSGKTTETISLTDYSKGVYFLTIGEETVKLIVE